MGRMEEWGSESVSGKDHDETMLIDREGRLVQFEELAGKGRSMA